ncbi:glycosyltransferase family 4 protein [Chloroflexi bacterium TSY]|nr:glycosyltransferase family 4 protein [Chloroflexi bacterium TSY]
MKILYLIPYVPNQIRVRPYQFLRTLVERGHDVTLATLWTSKEEQSDLETLKSLDIEIIAAHLPKSRSIINCIQALPTSLPTQAAFCWHPNFALQLQKLIHHSNFDVIQVEHLRGAKLGLSLQNAMRHSARPVPIVWDSVDCISHLFSQAAKDSRSLKGKLMARFELGRTESYEGWLVNQFPRIAVTSQSDANALYKLGNRCLANRSHSALESHKIAVIPNGVDLDSFCSGHQERDPTTIVFTGKMSYHANVTAALHLVKEVMPLVWESHPAVKVQIVGKDPIAEICALDTRKAHSKKQSSGIVEVTGTVSDLPPYLQRATIAAAPVPYGAGIQNKVLQAMACGTPVVASLQAASGLQAETGRDLLVAEDAEQFAQALRFLLEDEGKRNELGNAGRAYVEQKHSWESAVQKLESLYDEAIEATLIK